MPVGVEHSVETLRRRKVLSRTWGTFVVCWSLVRTLIVWAALGDYGINPWMYLGVDLASAGADAVTTPRMVLAFVDERYKIAARWLTISLLAFVVPDLYIFLGTRTMPKRVILAICVIIAATTTVATVAVVRKVIAGRRARATAAREINSGM